MNFDKSNKVLELEEKIKDFMEKNIYPNEDNVEKEVDKNIENGNPWIPLNIVKNLKDKAKAENLWNLWRPIAHGGSLTNLEYAPLCEIMGRSKWAPEVFNCSAPDTGNMEVFLKYGTDEQKNEWLDPLLNGDIRSAFLMTEPFVASSDATNIECSIQKDGDDYVINGRKWWSSGAGDERCKIFILMGKTAPSNPNKYEQQSMILVPKNTPGVKVLRPLHIFGYNDVPEGHMEIELDNVRVPAKNILLGEGRGFEIAQGRLGPGRIHHCMRIIGQAERALEMMCKRLKSRVAFGKAISEQSIWHDRIAESRILINQSRLLTLNAAHMMDTVGNKQAKAEIAMIKVAAPMMAQKVIDWAIQAHGGGGVSQEFKLAFMYSWNRVMRLVDGPDEVHKAQIAKIELRKH
jgi:acyl-CoA dehydrogenase